MVRMLTGLMFVALLALPAAAADVYGAYGGGYAGQPYTQGHHRLPVCDEPPVLSQVAEKFAYYDAHVIHSGLAIQHVDGVREAQLDVGGPSLIPRRFCRGTAWLSNGQRSEVVYLIEFQTGLASITWNVQSCLPRFDPYRVYDAWCRSIEP
jgi:opacity protein-like surface antigen